MELLGVDGFTIDENDHLYCTSWGQGFVAIIDTKTMAIKDYIHLPADIPASCAFCGDNMNILAVTTASYYADIASDKNAGFTILIDTLTKGRNPYIFG